MQLRQIARFVRHLPGIRQADFLWDAVREHYHRALDPRGVGVRISIGNIVTARIPPEFCGSDWDSYECETVAALVDWLAKHPGAIILDVGCSTGVFSVAALFADPKCEVIAFDSDLSSLVAASRVTKYASGTRLRLVRGLITDRAPETALPAALATTEEVLKGTIEGGHPGTTRYLCLNTPEAAGVPLYTLDSLLFESLPSGRPLLLKCDVEGAEALVLKGSRLLLRDIHPTLLLSVHPPALPAYGSSEAQLRAFLQQFGYRITSIASDHEEHWLCEYHQNDLHR